MAARRGGDDRAADGAGDDAGRDRVAGLGVRAAEALEDVAAAALESARAGTMAGIEADGVGLGRRLLDGLATGEPGRENAGDDERAHEKILPL